MLKRFVFVCACVASGWPGVRCWNRWIRKCFNWIGTNSQKQHECVRDSSRTTTPSHYEAPSFVFLFHFYAKIFCVEVSKRAIFLSFSRQLAKYDSARWISLKATAYRRGSDRTQAGGSNCRSAITTESSANVYAIFEWLHRSIINNEMLHISQPFKVSFSSVNNAQWHFSSLYSLIGYSQWLRFCWAQWRLEMVRIRRDWYYARAVMFVCQTCIIAAIHLKYLPNASSTVANVFNTSIFLGVASVNQFDDLQSATDDWSHEWLE